MPTANVSGPGVNQNTSNRNINVIPNECPICHVTITPSQISAGYAVGKWIEMYFRCANVNCQRAFIAIYDAAGGLNQFGVAGQYDLRATMPITPTAPAFPIEITTVSPSFVKLFTQAQAAEEHGLDEIAGPGFRKALEFLIKDYAISIASAPEDIAQIRNLPLQSVITNYLGEGRLNVVSSRAAWLGNDETHYERRWVGKDLSDLKKLISATVYFLSMEKLVEDLLRDMPHPGAAEPPTFTPGS
jgi:hypothetical protein